MLVTSIKAPYYFTAAFAVVRLGMLRVSAHGADLIPIHALYYTSPEQRKACLTNTIDEVVIVCQWRSVQKMQGFLFLVDRQEKLLQRWDQLLTINKLATSIIKLTFLNNSDIFVTNGLIS